MGYAAPATNDHAHETPGLREFSAFLRLRQGGAARTTWLVTEAPGGTMISVGADAACDWQIRAAFVPPRAFSVLVVGGRAFVRSGPEPGLLVDGRPVDDSWNPLAPEARIDIGLARFEVRTGFADVVTGEPVLDLQPSRRHEQEPVRPHHEVGAWTPQPRVHDVAVHAVVTPQPRAHEVAHAHDVAMASTAVVQRQESYGQPAPSQAPSAGRVSGRRRKATMETQEYGWAANGESSRVQRVGVPREQVVGREERAVRGAQQPVTPQKLVTPAAKGRPQQAVRNSTIELKLEDLDYAGTIPMPRRPNERTGEHVVSPSLLGSDEITRVTRGWRGLRYVGVAAFFASAYGAWLYLLDRI